MLRDEAVCQRRDNLTQADGTMWILFIGMPISSNTLKRCTTKHYISDYDGWRDSNLVKNTNTIKRASNRGSCQIQNALSGHLMGICSVDDGEDEIFNAGMSRESSVVEAILTVDCDSKTWWNHHTCRRRADTNLRLQVNQNDIWISFEKAEAFREQWKGFIRNWDETITCEKPKSREFSTNEVQGGCHASSDKRLIQKWAKHDNSKQNAKPKHILPKQMCCVWPQAWCHISYQTHRRHTCHFRTHRWKTETAWQRRFVPQVRR